MKNHFFIFLFLLFSAFYVDAFAADKKVCALSLSQSGCTGLLSIETDRYGDVVVTLENGNNTTGACFRGNGMGSKLNCWWIKVAGQANDSACHYFNRMHVSGSNIFRLQLQEGKTLPDDAEIYYDGSSAIEWQCDQNTNLWQSDKTLSHTYGTTCAALETPVLNSITNYVLNFTQVAGADYYTVAFYIGKDCVYQGTLNADGSTSFRPFVTDTYEIVVQAWTNTGDYSNESNALHESLTGDPQFLPASEICETVFSEGTTSCFAIVAETDEKGVITLTAVAADGGAEASTKWRQNGLPDKGLKFNGQPASEYFTRKKSTDGKSVMLTPIQSANPELGRLLTFNEYGEGENAEWYTSQNNNAYATTVHFSYRYGTICPKLATPVITAITDSVPVFEPIEGADEYVALVYLGDQLKYKLYIQPGEQLHFVPDETATYQVTLTAYGQGIKHSDESAAFDWALQKKEIEVGPSEYCNISRGSGGDTFRISFETLVNGNVEITISGDGKTAFRGNGMGDDLGYFKVGTLGASEYFEPLFLGTGELTYTLKIKDPKYLPAKGEKITFNGIVAYQTATNTNAYGTYQFSYTYGSVCNHLETPVITSLQTDGSWTLDHEIAGAEAYRVMVYRDGFLMQDANMQYGEKLTFSPWHNFIYLVYVQAVTTAEVMNSDLSTPVEWKVTASGEDLPMSTVCDKQVYSEGLCGGIVLNMITDQQGRVHISIKNDPGHSIRFRNKGLSKMLYINDDISTYFDFAYASVDSTEIIYTPKKSASSIIRTGDIIRSMAYLEWYSDCNNNGYTTTLFSYLYGTDCTFKPTRLDRPQIVEISSAGDIIFDSVPNATSYLVQVSDGDDSPVEEYPIQWGDRIRRDYVILVGFDYYVRLQAWPDAASEMWRESLWSDAMLWQPSDITGIRNVNENVNANVSRKMMIEGKLVIIRNGVMYNALGGIFSRKSKVESQK